MTSEKLAKAKEEINSWPDETREGEKMFTTRDISGLVRKAKTLLAAIEDQQREIAFLHNAIADLQVDASPDSQHKAALKFLTNAVLKQLRDLRAEKLKEGHPVASLYFLARDYHNALSETKAMWDQQQDQLQALGSIQACNHMIDWLLALVGLKEGERFE